MTKPNYWSVPPLWPGATVGIIAGGPSLTQEQVDKLKGLKVIAINNAYLLAPWADVLYGCDKKWWKWHPAALEFQGIKVTMMEPVHESIYQIRNGGTPGLCLKPDGLATGRNGGYQAINLAYHLGAKIVILIGYDMKPGLKGEVHWHEEHPTATPKSILPRWVKHYSSIVEPLKEQGVRVINCTPGSALKCFEQMDLDVAVKRARKNRL
jgi:hypothetical protein